MEERKRRFEEREHVTPQIKSQLERVLGKGALPVHIFSPSADIPNEKAVRLVVLSPDAPFTREAGSLAEKIPWRCSPSAARRLA
jgi:hypothetical protein